MQTFLPYPSFEDSARVLDLKRLGKQRVEVIQIVRALTVPGYAWKSHPAVLMWQGHEEALGRYGLAMCDAWVARGFDDTCAGTIVDDLAVYGVTEIRSEEALRAAGAMPPWTADDKVLESHRSALVRKDPERYGPLFPDAPADLPYVWPVRSPAVVEAEQRKVENAVKREQRRREKLALELDKKRRARSAAAKRAARTRAANKKAAERQGS